MEKKLQRSNDRMIGGVCGGIGQYFGIDPTLVRLAWVLISLFGGTGIVLYPIAWFLIPDAEGRRDTLALVICLALLVFPGSCCWFSWLFGMFGAVLGSN